MFSARRKKTNKKKSCHSSLQPYHRPRRGSTGRHGDNPQIRTKIIKSTTRLWVASILHT
jgi:hypothetical protein